MTYEIKTSKSYDGSWRATSKALLDPTPSGDRYLELTTYKVRGGIGSFASVFIFKQDGAFTSKTTEIFGDFSKPNIVFIPCNRVTEKAIIQAHKTALQQMDSLIEEAKAFYLKMNSETDN